MLLTRHDRPRTGSPALLSALPLPSHFQRLPAAQRCGRPTPTLRQWLRGHRRVPVLPLGSRADRRGLGRCPGPHATGSGPRAPSGRPAPPEVASCHRSATHGLPVPPRVPLSHRYPDTGLLTPNAGSRPVSGADFWSMPLRPSAHSGRGVCRTCRGCHRALARRTRSRRGSASAAAGLAVLCSGRTRESWCPSFTRAGTYGRVQRG